MAARLVSVVPVLLARPARAHGRPNPTNVNRYRYAVRRTTVSHYAWIVPLVAVALAQIAVVTTSVYLHRALAHRALRSGRSRICFSGVSG